MNSRIYNDFANLIKEVSTKDKTLTFLHNLGYSVRNGVEQLGVFQVESEGVRIPSVWVVAYPEPIMERNQEVSLVISLPTYDSIHRVISSDINPFRVETTIYFSSEGEVRKFVRLPNSIEDKREKVDGDRQDSLYGDSLSDDDKRLLMNISGEIRKRLG